MQIRQLARGLRTRKNSKAAGPKSEIKAGLGSISDFAISHGFRMSLVAFHQYSRTVVGLRQITGQTRKVNGFNKSPDRVQKRARARYLCLFNAEFRRDFSSN
jgi:hypothetical protein